MLDVLSQLSSTELAQHRILEFSCDRTRVPFLVASAGHRVLAAGSDPEALANMAERLVPSTPAHAEITARVELRLADVRSFYFNEDFKAVHLPASHLAPLDADQRRDVLERAGSHLAPGGLLIISTQEVRHPATPLVGSTVSASAAAARALTGWNGGPTPPTSHPNADQGESIGSAWLGDTCTRLGMTVTFQRSRPDPTYAGCTHVTLAAHRR